MTWPNVPLQDLAAPFRGSITDGPFGSHLARHHYRDSGPLVVRLQNIGDGVFIDSPAHIDPDHFETLRKHEVLEGDLLIASLGEVLPRACLMPSGLGRAIVKADCIRVRLRDDVDPKWVNYSLQRPAARKWAEQHRHGVGRPRLGLKGIRAIPTPLPPLSEQRRIVEILEDHFSRLDAAYRYILAGDLRRKALIRSVLINLIPDLDRYPSSWEHSTVGAAGRVELGRQRHPDWHSGPNMKPYLKVANVFEDRIDTTNVMEMHWPDGSFDRFRLRPGDVLLNEGQTPELLGRPAIYRGDPAEVAFTNSLIRFVASPRVLPEFALLVFRRHMHAGRFKRESRITTNIAHLSASRLKRIEFPIPPMPEQQQLVARAEHRLGAVAALDRQTALVRRRTEGLRRAVLTAAFEGRLTGQQSDDEAIEAKAKEMDRVP